MKNNCLEITYPSGIEGFVENKRSFCVEGNIIYNGVVPNDSKLQVCLYNKDNELIRNVMCDKKNKDIFAYYDKLITYDENIDKNREKLKEFGFPLLVVNDVNYPESSLHNGSIKAWYSDTKFKAIIVNASDKTSGASFDDGFNLYDENGMPYSLLQMGEYTIEVTLKINDEILKTCKKIVIGKRDKQLICRFNPLSHKERMIKWCKENNISIINDLIPGYLDSYLDNWQYHKGVLSMYRANDLCLFDDVDVVMFDYLIDKTSTSYETELAYLQNSNKLKSRFEVYYYDIGEAILNKNNEEIIADIKKFDENDYGTFYRVDELKNDGIENVYNLNEDNIKSFNIDLDNVLINNNTFAITGVIKPIQLDPKDFVLKEDNTYEVLDYPKQIRYEFNIDGNIVIYNRELYMERINNISIGKSVYEFYNVFNIKEFNRISVKAECIYNKGMIVNINRTININKKD